MIWVKKCDKRCCEKVFSGEQRCCIKGAVKVCERCSGVVKCVLKGVMKGVVTGVATYVVQGIVKGFVKRSCEQMCNM